MTSAVALAQEDGFLAFGYAYWVEQLRSGEMSLKKIRQEKHCRDVWHVVRGVTAFVRRLQGTHMTGAMVRDAAHSYVSQFLQPDEHCPPVNIILGIIHQAGVLSAVEIEGKTYITFNENHPLVAACK